MRLSGTTAAELGREANDRGKEKGLTCVTTTRQEACQTTQLETTVATILGLKPYRVALCGTAHDLSD